MKRLFAILILLASAAILIYFAVSAKTAEPSVGDADGDGKVTFEDYILVRLAADRRVNLDESHFKASDIDANGTLDKNDYIVVKAHVVFGESLSEHIHTPAKVNGLEPTCAKPGYTESTVCSVCGEVLEKRKDIPAKGHIFKDGICTVCGERKSSDGLEFFSNGDGTCFVSGIGSCAEKDIVIPSVSPEGEDVTGIGSKAFINNTYVRSVVIPGSVTGIGEKAFYCCYNLKTLSIPDSVKAIGSLAFFNTGYYNVSTNWKDGILYIGNHLIKASETLKGSLSVKKGTVCIADEAFSGITDITGVTLPNGLIGIGNKAFYNCYNITSVNIPSSVVYIGDYAFCSCSGLTGISIPGSVRSIGDYAFCYCSDMKNVTISVGVETIGANAFCSCTSITEVVIPDGVVKLGNDAFFNCEKLNSIIIPDSVVQIGSGAFDGTAYFTDFSNWEKGYLYIGNHLIKAFDSVNGELKIKEGTVCIGDYALYECTGIKSVIIPDGVKAIGNGAFYGCTGLEGATIPGSVAVIGDSAFSSCTGLAEINIPHGVRRIGNSAFGSCSSLNAVNISDTVENIGEGAFWKCTSLTSITIPDTVTGIGGYAFYGCFSLNDVYYTGSKEQWKKMTVGRDNDELLGADIHYNS